MGSPQAGDVSRIQSPEQSSRGGGTASGPYTENSRRFVPPALPTELPAHSRNIRDVDERSQVSSISLRLPSGPTAVEMTPTIPRPQVLVTRATDDSFIRGHGYEQEERHTSELPLQNIVSIYNVRDPIVDRGQSVGSMSSRFKALPSTPGWSEGPYSDVEYRDSSPQLHSQPSTSVLTPLRQKPEPPARKPNLYVSEQHPQQSHQSWLRRLANAIHLLHKPYFLDDKLMSRLGTERKPTRAATWRHYFRLDENKYRPAVPRVYREANYWYKEPNEDGKLWTHRDIMERETSGQFIVECYVSPYDGKRKELIVQATDDILDMGVECQSAWSRTFIRSATPRMIGLSQWAYPEAQSASGKYTAGEIVSIVLKWIPSTLIISYFMVAPDYAIGTDRNNGRYDALQYYWWSYPRAAINTREIPRSILAASEHRETDAGTTTVTPRRLQPRFLMFRDHIALATARDRIPKHSRFRRSYASAPDAAELRPDPYPDVEYSPNDNLYPIRPEFDQTGRATSEDTLWSEKRSFEDYCHYPEQSYVFVSFCNDHFPNLDDMMSKDAQMLADIGVRAARRRDVPAYWLCSSCMPFTTVAEMEKDVAQLNDVVRSADSLAIVVRLQASEGETMEEQLRAALRYYGRRMWTLPEVLLLRQGTKIMIYAISDRPLFDAPNTREPILKTKLELVQIAYEDSLDARQLVDHFEGTLILEPLELISLGLKLLGDREAGKNALEADKVYALMGFMRRRPPINRNDLPFAAFVRLSMANHSEMMLERMACILPRDRKQDIFDLRDAFGCSLWDIYPSCQVAGLGVSDTIILDGAHAASIRWKSFAEIAHIHAETFTRFWIRTLFIYSPWSWYLGTILTAIGTSACIQID